MRDKEEKERYTYLNAEFSKIAKRHEKTFLSDQCKEIEGGKKEWERLSKKLDTKGNFHGKMGTIKDRYGIDLKQADIKKR